MGQKLGQHFLIDQTVLDAIVQDIQKLYGQTQATTILEIGPGQGALTQHIYQVPRHFHCIEKDESMRPYLEAFLDPIQITQGDVLEYGENHEAGDNMIVVGNLPYYITSPILKKFFRTHTTTQGGVFLIQKEVADKLVTTAIKKSYLRRLINNHYTVDYAFTVPPTSFNPPPKVDSAVIIIHRKLAPEVPDEQALLTLLDLLAPYSRKTLSRIAKINAKKGINLTISDRLKTKRLEQCTRTDIKLLLSA